MNEHHVKELDESFEKKFKPYTSLIGHICDNVSTNDLMTPGKICVEVLGENHTRAALQRLVKSSKFTQKEKDQFVYMVVYQNLTQDQDLFLAFKHNELHENSQELSFSGKVMFFHKVLLDCEGKFAGQTKKLISTKWRSEIAAIMNKSVSNVYHNFIFTKII